MTASERWRRFRDSLRDALDADPAVAGMGVESVAAGEIRLLCPKGHFIANVAVIVLDDRGILLRPRGKDKQHFGDVFNDPNHGFRVDDSTTSGRLRVRARCQRGKCSYHGAFDYEALSRELCEAVSAGHLEHRLTN
jgi:hypothetical protein